MSLRAWGATGGEYSDHSAPTFLIADDDAVRAYICGRKN